jgi:hypothetical protein
VTIRKPARPRCNGSRAAFQDVDRRLEGRDHLLDAFSVCDLYCSSSVSGARAALAGKIAAASQPRPVLAEAPCAAGPGRHLAEEMQLRAKA